jgi:hypothetical protein
MIAAIIGMMVLIGAGLFLFVFGLVVFYAIHGFKGYIDEESCLCLAIAIAGVLLIWFGCHVAPFSLEVVL